MIGKKISVYVRKIKEKGRFPNEPEFSLINPRQKTEDRKSTPVVSYRDRGISELEKIMKEEPDQRVVVRIKKIIYFSESRDFNGLEVAYRGVVGFMYKSEISYQDGSKFHEMIGEEISVYVHNIYKISDNYKRLEFSLINPLERIEDEKSLAEDHRSGEEVEVKVVGVFKKNLGLIVSYKGSIQGVIPFNERDAPLSNLKEFVGKDLQGYISGITFTKVNKISFSFRPNDIAAVDMNVSFSGVSRIKASEYLGGADSDKIDVGRIIFNKDGYAQAVKRRREEGGITKESIEEAKALLEEFGMISKEGTPLTQHEDLNQVVKELTKTDVSLYLKQENKNVTGSFKDRSPVAFLRQVKTLIDEYNDGSRIEPITIVLKAVSTGNHGKSSMKVVKMVEEYITNHKPHLKNKLIVRGEVTMEVGTKKHKQKAIRDLGGSDTVRTTYPVWHELAGDDITSYRKAEDIVFEEVKRGGQVNEIIMQTRHSDGDVVSGYATMALEIDEALEEILGGNGLSINDLAEGEIVKYTSLGSGGNYAGNLESRVDHENADIYAVASAPADMTYRSLETGTIIREDISLGDILVDGTAATPEQHAIDRIVELGSGVLRVTERDALYATALIYATTKILVEPTSGLALAGMLLNMDLTPKVKHAVIVLSSKNLDQKAIDEITRISLKGIRGIKDYFSNRQKVISEGRSKQMSDNAALQQEVGGIDLNPEHVQMNVQGAGRFNILTSTEAEIYRYRNIDTFVPVIINVAPITNLPLLLGLNGNGEPTPYADSNETHLDLSYNRYFALREQLV
ncbi:MAG: threonine dehydratase [Candidatus Omnitrophota bacterium]|jgi:threonine dehydratase